MNLFENRSARARVYNKPRFTFTLTIKTNTLDVTGKRRILNRPEQKRALKKCRRKNVSSERKEKKNPYTCIARYIHDENNTNERRFSNYTRFIGRILNTPTNREYFFFYTLQYCFLVWHETNNNIFKRSRHSTRRQWYL